MECQNIPGSAIVVIHRNKSHFINLGTAYGRHPVTEHTNFLIGSITKQLDALLEGIFVDRGQLDFLGTCASIYPGFNLLDPITTQLLTLQDLESYHSGYPYHGYDYTWGYGWPGTRAEYFAGVNLLQPVAGIRQNFLYSNILQAYGIFAIEQYFNDTWENLIATEVFEPLGMRRTFPSTPEAVQAGDLAAPYLVLSNDSFTRIIASKDTNGVADNSVAAAGVVYSSTKDMAKYIKMVMNSGLLENGTPLISSENFLTNIYNTWTAIDPLIKGEFLVFPAYPQNSATLARYAAGLGWILDVYSGIRHNWHNGGLYGMSSQLSIFPDEDFAFLWLINTEFGLVPDPTYNFALYASDIWRFGRSWMPIAYPYLCPDLTQAPVRAKRELTTPKNLKADITGIYFTPWFGTITITLDVNNNFPITWRDTSGFVYDFTEFPPFTNLWFVDEVSFLPDVPLIDTGEFALILFNLDANNNVVSILVDFEPGVSNPITFLKQ